MKVQALIRLARFEHIVVWHNYCRIVNITARKIKHGVKRPWYTMVE